MASILVVCTGNVCRSPIAEGMLRAALAARLDDDAPLVASAGTAGWEGSGAMPESVAAAAERGIDISSHAARRLLAEHVRGADLVLAMAAEHRDQIARLDPGARARTFTLKEAVRLLEALPPEEPPPNRGELTELVDRADALRRSGSSDDPRDEDVVDPLGMPDHTYRAIAWELETWCGRLVDALVGTAPARSGPGAAEA